MWRRDVTRELGNRCYAVLLYFLIDSSCPVEKVDVCFILDSSEFVAGDSANGINYWGLIKDFVRIIVAQLPMGLDAVRVGVVTFSDEATLEFPLNRHTTPDAAEDAIQRLTHRNGGADLPQALINARTECFNASNGDRPDARNVAVLLTTGRSSSEGRRYRAVMEAEALRYSGVDLTEAEALKNSGVDLMVIGVTDTIDYSLLREISSQPQLEGQNVFRAPDFQAVSAVQQRLRVECDPSTNGKAIKACCGLTAPPPPLPTQPIC